MADVTNLYTNGRFTYLVPKIKSIEMKKEQLDRIKDNIKWLIDNGTFKESTTAYVQATNSIKVLEDAIQIEERKGAICKCGGNARVALDCTRKPCKHPMYNTEKNTIPQKYMSFS